MSSTVIEAVSIEINCPNFNHCFVTWINRNHQFDYKTKEKKVVRQGAISLYEEAFAAWKKVFDAWKRGDFKNKDKK